MRRAESVNRGAYDDSRAGEARRQRGCVTVAREEIPSGKAIRGGERGEGTRSSGIHPRCGGRGPGPALRFVRCTRSGGKRFRMLSTVVGRTSAEVAEPTRARCAALRSPLRRRRAPGGGTPAQTGCSEIGWERPRCGQDRRGSADPRGSGRLRGWSWRRSTTRGGGCRGARPARRGARSPNSTATSSPRAREARAQAGARGERGGSPAREEEVPATSSIRGAVPLAPSRSPD